MIMRGNIPISFVIAVSLLLTGCSSRALHEAQRVVAEADSLRAEGVAYTDSMALAEAYNTLEKWQYLYPTDYARACYYYGRLLRNNDDPVAAMRVFINATHSHSRDYHILARTYSNMGSICHLASEYQLSCDMYSRSADLFLRNGDTLLYYYGLNNMAFEKMLSDESETCFTILDSLPLSYMTESDIAYYDLTRSEGYLRQGLYDSTIFFAGKALSFLEEKSSAFMLLAQAYSYMGIQDSAVLYAEIALNNSPTLEELNNALFIITNDDQTKDKESIRQVAADRADVQKLLEIRQGKLSQATQLLEQDLTRRPDWRWWLIAALMIFFGIISFVSLRIWRKRKQMLEMRVETMANNHIDDIITSIKQHIDITDLNHTLHWKDYASMKLDADLYMGSIVSKLETYKLNEVEIRFCILTILDMSLKQIADNIHYGYPSGIKTLKKRTAVKLGTTPPNLKEFLFKMMTNSLF